MTGTLANWIKIDDSLADFAQIIPRLQAYAGLAAHWRDIALGIGNSVAGAPVDSPVKLATYLATHIGDAPVVQVFADLGLAGLHADIAKIADDFVDPDAPWAKLLRPANDFVESYRDKAAEEGGLDDGDNPGLVPLKIPRLAADADTGLGPATLSFSVGAQAGLACEAGAVWPFRGDRAKPGLLRIGAAGAVSARAGISLPFGKIGTGAASAEGSAEAELQFFYSPSPADAVYAQALAGALAHLPNPLNLADISEAVRHGGMEGMVLGCKGAVSAGLSATLGADFDFRQLASVSAGLVARLDFKRNAAWLLSVRQDETSLRFVLSRGLAREKAWSVGVDIGIDYSGLARQVHDALSDAVDLTGPGLNAIRPFLSPGTYLAEKAGGLLEALVGSVVAEPGLKAALLADLGRVLGQPGANDLALADYVREAVIDLAASHAGGILADTEQWARHVAEGLAAKFPALGVDDGMDALVARITPMLADVKGLFEGAVATAASQPGMADALSDIGITLNTKLKKADQLAAGIRDVVSKFDAFSRQALEKTGEGVEHKLKARFGWSGGDSRGEQYELIGWFDAVNTDTAALWKALVTGQLEPFQRILADPDSAPAGLRLDPASSLARFAGKHNGFALEIVVLGLALSIRSIITAEAKIALSANGDVTVVAKGSALKEVDGFDEGRSASFISTWDLALLKADDPALGGQRKMGVSLKLGHSDKDFERKELDGFLGGLREQGLIDPSRYKSAQDAYQAWLISPPVTKKVKGRVDVSLSLNALAVARMVALGRVCGTEGSRGHKAVFTLAAKTLMDCGAADAERFDRDCREARRDRSFPELAKVEDPWDIVYALRNVDLDPPQSSVVRAHDYTAFGKIIELSKTFPQILAQMARIYDAIPVGTQGQGAPWTEKDYVNAELDLAKNAGKWLRLNQKMIFWFKSDMHPAMVAFLRLLTDMNRVMATSDPLEGLGTRVDVSTASSMIAITMQEKGGTVEVI